MANFTKKQISNISKDLYDWISDKDGDEPLFREAAINLIALGLDEIRFDSSRNGRVKPCDIECLLPQLIQHINTISTRKDKDNSLYLSLPPKTQKSIHDYVVYSLKSEKEWLPIMIRKYRY